MTRIMAYNKSSKFMSFIINSLIISIFFENFKLFSVLGAAFKPIHIILILSIIYNLFCGKVLVTDFFVGMFFLILPIFPLYRIGDFTEWFKSYFIYFIMVAFMMTSMRNFINEFKLNYKKYIRLFLYVIAITQILAIIQFILMNFFNTFFLLNLWGSFQFHANQFGMSNGFYRAYSVFLEPSFLAWVSNSSFATLLFIDKDLLKKNVRVFFLVLNIFSVFCTISTSGIALTLVLFFVYLLVNSKNAGKTVISLIIAVSFIFVILSFTDLLSPLERISREIRTEGTSGYERLVTPLLYIQKTFEFYPFFGRGLGQEGMVDAVGVIGNYSGIQNSVFGIFVCFGLSTVLFLIPACVYVYNKIKVNRKWAILFINLFGIYVSTGAWCSVDTFIFLILLTGIGWGSIYKNVNTLQY